MTHPPTPTDAVPFAMAVPYPPGAAAVQVTKNGQVVSRQVVARALLRDAVTALPDAAFVRTPAQLRTALLNQIAAFDQHLAVGDQTGARDFLQNGIQALVVTSLLDSYPTASPLQYTKAQLLALVDELVQRLS
jgi:hypothetical protein